MRFIFFLFPWLELFTLIELGIRTSAFTALAYVFTTAIVGLAILQRQGRSMIERLMQGRAGRLIGPELLLDDMAIGFAGVLLIIPGMITDLVALAVMISPLRRRLAKVLRRSEPALNMPERAARGHETIEGDFRHVDDEIDR